MGASESLRVKHHVVSAGYLRAFTADAKRAMFLDKQTLTAKLVGVRDMFTIEHLNSSRVDGEWDDELEREWDRVEGVIVPPVRRLIAGERFDADRDAVKILAAMHLIRSYAYVEVHARIAREVGAESPERLENDDEALALFESEYGRPPEEDEIAGIVRVRFEELVAGNLLRVEQMAANYNKIRERFEPLHVQLLSTSSRGVQFVTGSAPAVHFDSLGLRVGFPDLALGDADHFYMPLAPNLAAMLTTKVEGDFVIDPMTTKRMNQIVWRASPRFLVCHPGVDPNRCLWQSGFTASAYRIGLANCLDASEPIGECCHPVNEVGVCVGGSRGLRRTRQDERSPRVSVCRSGDSREYPP